MDYRDFKVGDKVLITSKVPSQHNWRNSWAINMDEYVNDGVIYEIRSMGSSGIRLRNAETYSDINFGWPSDCLTLYTGKKGRKPSIQSIIKKLKEGKKIKVNLHPEAVIYYLFQDEVRCIIKDISYPSAYTLLGLEEYFKSLPVNKLEVLK